MTDSEIIKAIKDIQDVRGYINKLRAENERLKARIDKFKRQQAEIERLKTGYDAFIRNYKECAECAMEAVRDFAEQMKARAYTAENEWSHGEHPLVVEVDDIDELVAEMEG